MKLLAVLSVVCTGAFVCSQDFGPLATRNQRALSLPFLRFIPRSGVLGVGEQSLDLGWSVANDYKVFPGVLEDQETSRFTFLYRKGLPHDSEWSVEVPVLVRGGGFMDPIIDWWHRSILGTHGQPRSFAPDGLCIITEPKGHFGSAWGLGDLTFTFAKKIHPNVTASVAIKAPTGNDGQLLGSGGLDAGVAVDGHYAFAKKWTLFGQLGYVHQGPSTAMKGSRESIDQEALSLVFAPNSRDAWILQWQNEPSAFRTMVAGSDNSHRMASLGYQRKLDSNRTLELFFSEDGDFLNNKLPQLVNIAPDFTMGLRLTVRWR